MSFLNQRMSKVVGPLAFGSDAQPSALRGPAESIFQFKEIWPIDPLSINTPLLLKQYVYQNMT